MINWVQEHWKFIIATLAPIGYGLKEALNDDIMTNEEWGTLAGLVVVAIGVLAKGNKQPETPPTPPEELA